MLRLLPDSDRERCIEEDLPYGDLTTHLLGIDAPRSNCHFNPPCTTLCCTEEAARVLATCGARLTSCMLVLSSVYFGKPADIAVSVTLCT